MKTIVLTLFGLGLLLGFVGTEKASAQGNYVVVWVLEVRYTPTDTWHVAGTYTSYASAQESYVVRARHGGYTEMRIRQTYQRRPWFTDRARLRASAATKLFPLPR
jgi:hypothetical protein